MSFTNKEILSYSKECNVLYVEDDATLRESSRKLFSNYFELIDTACDGYEGVECFKNFIEENHTPYDLVISDISMPRMNGIEMCKKILAQIPDQAIILISAHNEPEIFYQAIEIGANAFLSKPLNDALLKQAFYKVCRSISDRKNRKYFYEQLEIQVRQHQRKLEALYQEDVLTGLHNIHALMQTLKQRAEGSLALININKFHEINEYYGYHVGDSILQQLANLPLEHFDEIAEVYRGHSDEFALLAKPSCSLKMLDDALEALQTNLMTQTFVVDYDGKDTDMTLPVQVSIGLAGGGDDLFMRATSALHKAKYDESGKISFDASLPIKQAYKEKFAMVKTLHRAVMDCRIVAYYQPIVENSSKHIVKYETLARLIDQNGTVMTPGSFLNIAKKAHLYHVISQTIFQQACATFRHRLESFTFNIERDDILNQKTCAYLLEMIDSFSEPQRVVIELVETEQMVQTQSFTQFITELKKRGCKLSIDDFGTGYSNFEYLTRLEPDIIKIDGSLIKNIRTMPRSRIIVEAIVQFAQKMGIQTVAEYVENEEIFELVSALGITYSQGYYFGKPQLHLQR
ncbi:MAG: EAL domain-containing protein [Campylobacterales bacterium]|nr:EAL domain-containing protein [Campylobacterales bacterium]